MHTKDKRPRISVVQNFICDLPERLKVIEKNTPKISEVWKDYEFFVNFNAVKNNKEVHEIYKKNIPKLNYYNNLEKDWAGIVLAMVNEVKTPYVIFINEDQQFNMSYDDWDNIINECFIENDVDYILLNKIEKYNNGAFIDGYFPDHIPNHAQQFWGQYPAPKYGEGNHVWFYDGKFARHKRVSVEAVYKTKWLKDRLEEFLIKGDSCTHDIPFRKKHICHFYEGYYDFWNGMVRFADMKCAIPKNNIIIHFEDVKQNEYHPLHPNNKKI